ncbi:MAG TPA: hypothetical protein VI072_17385 [Polyangiaceae bacterium]
MYANCGRARSEHGAEPTAEDYTCRVNGGDWRYDCPDPIAHQLLEVAKARGLLDATGPSLLCQTP